METVTLENTAIRIIWKDEGMEVLNKISGEPWQMSFATFRLEWPGKCINGDAMTLVTTDMGRHALAFQLLDSSCDLTAELIYELDGNHPWFRKRLRFRTTQDLPTPARIVVDWQATAPRPIRQVGWGLRYGNDVVGENGFKCYTRESLSGSPMWMRDWFVGMERPIGYTRPCVNGIELFHHPVWENGLIECFPAIYGAARDAEQVPRAFAEYLEHVRLPAITKPFVVLSTGYSSRSLGGGEYANSMDANDRFLDAVIGTGIQPDAIGLDAGYFDRRSLFRAKGDSEVDTRLVAYANRARVAGMDLSLWVSENGPVGIDSDWIRSQGWRTGKGSGWQKGLFPDVDYVVMMDPTYETALTERFEQLVGRVGARHLKIDWDNECATHPDFANKYPTYEHVREASVNAFNRIDRRIRLVNPNVLTRKGWWPSPWWLCYGNHMWLSNSGDSEYSDWPSRTQQDREITQRDASYYNITRMAESPVPLNSFDNHGFSDAIDNPCYYTDHGWLDNLIMQFTRGTLYLQMLICPEDIRELRARNLKRSLEWFRFHAHSLSSRHATMVGGNPGCGEIYGYLHPFSSDNAWIVFRNPSPQPQRIEPPLSEWLGWKPETVRQVYPFWTDAPHLNPLTLSGHQVRLFRLYRERQSKASPVSGIPFIVTQNNGDYIYCFPGSRPLTPEIGPNVHPEMQIPGLTATTTADMPISGGWRKQWYVGIPYRFENPELIVTVRGSQAMLDRLTVRAGTNRRRKALEDNPLPAERIFRREMRGLNSSLVMGTLGPRERDDYVFGPLPDGGFFSVTLDILGSGAADARLECWITGFEPPARTVVRLAVGPMNGPLLPPYPLGFSRALLLTPFPEPRPTGVPPRNSVDAGSST